MKRKLSIVFALLILIGCAGQQMNVTPQRAFYEAQTLYINAWESYHSVWSAIPESDPRKAEWVNEYHPKFLKANELLMKYTENPNATTLALVNMAVDDCQAILIQLAIKKEAK